MQWFGGLARRFCYWRPGPCCCSYNAPMRMHDTLLKSCVVFVAFPRFHGHSQALENLPVTTRPTASQARLAHCTAGWVWQIAYTKTPNIIQLCCGLRWQPPLRFVSRGTQRDLLIHSLQQASDAMALVISCSDLTSPLPIMRVANGGIST